MPSRHPIMPRRFRRRTVRSKNTFNSYFEEKKTCEYLRNLMHSRFLNSETEGLFNFTMTVLGQETMIDLIRRRYPEITEDKKFDDWIEEESLECNISAKTLKELLTEDVDREISIRLRKFADCTEPDIEMRLSALQKTFDLTHTEMEIVSFFYLKDTSQITADFLGGAVADFGSISVFRNYGDILLGLGRDDFLDSVAKGNLFKAEIIEKNRDNEIEITAWCADYLSGLCEADLSHEFFTKDNDEALMVSDFDVPEDNLMVLDTLLKSNSRQNILFYGAAGTGKTSFARSLAKKYGKGLFTVKTPETDEHKDRLRAIFATVNLADKENSIVLVDEADEVLNSHKSFSFESKTNKSWINQFLESHEKKVIWITNRSEWIDPSTMRRFSFSTEFRKLNRKTRLKVLQYELGKKGVKEYFTEAELNEICTTYNVDAGGIVNAISTLNIASDTDKEAALRKVKAVLKNHEKATGGKRGGNMKEREFDSYSIEGLNTSLNLKDVISAMQGYDVQPNTKNLSIAMLLYGMPGTGKSEFVYYLGNVLGKEVLLKRASDIQSCWVGMTEKNIASAFAEAQETNSILFFDEADTFLFPRKSAQRSWEISFTNELLTQMESYKGIVVFATNDMEGLDHASLRRFKFKIEFRPLTPEGNLNFYNSLLKGAVQDGKELSEEEIAAIRRIKNLTPGDFAVVKDQMSFMETSAITHRMMIEALANEVRYKKGVKELGF